MSVTNNVVDMPITLSEVATILGVTSNLKSVCTTSAINKFSAVKPVDLNQVVHPTYADLVGINFGLIPTPMQLNINGPIIGTPFPLPWEYRGPQGGSTSPYRLGDFCVYESSSSTTQKGYKHDSQNFLEAKDFSLDVLNGANSILPVQCMMNGKKLQFSTNTGANINIDLKDLRLDYKSTADVGAQITSTVASLTCGYWRIGLLCYIPTYSKNDTTGVVATAMSSYLVCAKDTITTNFVENYTTQCVRFNYGADLALTLMKRAMLWDGDTNKSFTAIPCLVYDTSYDESLGQWNTPSKILTFPSAEKIKINMSNILTIALDTSSVGMAVNGTACTATVKGYAIKKSVLDNFILQTVKNTITLKVTRPSGDVWSNPRVTIANKSCTVSAGSIGSTVTLEVTWSTDAKTIAKTAASAGVGSTVPLPVQVKYFSAMKNSDVIWESTIGIFIVS